MILYDNENKPYIKYSSDEVDKVLKSLGKAHKSFDTVKKTGKAHELKLIMYSVGKDEFKEYIPHGEID